MFAYCFCSQDGWTVGDTKHGPVTVVLSCLIHVYIPNLPLHLSNLSGPPNQHVASCSTPGHLMSEVHC